MFVKLSVILIIVRSVIGQKQIQDWELAVVVKNEIKLLYSNGSQIDSKSQPFSSLKALAYDDIRKQFIVSDMDMENDTIYTIQLTKETDVTIPIIKELPGDVQGLAVDPIDDILYWTDASNHAINYVLLNSSVYESKPLFIFDGKHPHSLAIDVCKRYIYWTNPSHSNPTIERSRLDGKDHKILVDSFIQSPEGITIDYGSKRLYWADSRPGSSAGRIESMNLDGSDRKIVIERNTMQPFGITVDRDAIYFTDINNRGLYKFLKILEPDDEPEKLASFSEVPMGLVTNNDAVREIPQCNSYEQAVDNYMENGINEANKTETTPETDKMQRCLNDGEYLGSYCKCKRGFVGKYCEHSLCFNYCFNGDCYISSLGNPQCRCNKGYYGDRCQKNKCEGYCLNGGDCGIYSSKNMMKCQCREGFIGDRCEYSIQVCNIYCEDRESNELFSDKYELLCRCANGINFEQQNKSAAPLISESQETDYLRELNQPIIYLAASLILCILIIISLIVYIHTMSKRRPRIKKRIIVNKNVTPLTYRPQPNSEQCEITIENCCNMNICETPCFEPREDKKKLLHNMENENLY